MNLTPAQITELRHVHTTNEYADREIFYSLLEVGLVRFGMTKVQIGRRADWEHRPLLTTAGRCLLEEINIRELKDLLRQARPSVAAGGGVDLANRIDAALET